MRKLLGLIELVVDVAAAYQQVHKPEKRMRLAGSDLLMVVAVLMLLVAIAFGIAAMFTALMVLGAVYASLLTAGISLAVALASLEISRRLGRSASRRS